MRHCSCGDLVDGGETRCARCSALQALGLEPSASEQEIREAYRVLVKVWHPDRFQRDQKLKTAAEEKLKSLNAAFMFLTGQPGAPKRQPARKPAGQPVHQAQPRSERQPVQRMTRRRRRLMPSSAVLVCLGALTCGILLAALAVRSIDSALASDPAVGGLYTGLRAGVAGTFRQAERSIWNGAGDRLHGLLPQNSAPAAAVPANQPQAHPDAVGQSVRRRELGSARPAPIRLLPYVTVGLTRDEITAIEGAPTASTGNKLVYSGSELYLTDGKVSGWKIDPASAHIRVKLWPDAPVDPDLDSFGVGSSRDVVLVVQGTPTYFSANTFGYGGSEVYFQNGRVVSWKIDPAWPLRTGPQ